MTTFSLAPDMAERFSAFLASQEFRTLPDQAVSRYWEDESGKISISLTGDTLTLDGHAGFYFPPRKGSRAHPMKRLLALASRAGQRRLPQPVRMLEYPAAFDAAMAENPFPGQAVPPEAIDFEKMRTTHGVVRTIQEFRESFFARDRYELGFHMVKSQFYLNLLLAHVPFRNIRSVLEIGAGSGNLSALLFHALQSGRIVVIDLPKVLCFSIPFLVDLFPRAKTVLPNEAAATDLESADLVFLTPNQTGLLRDHSLDLAVNTESFQEMEHGQVADYFDLIQRVVRPGGHFFTSNRVQKYPYETESSAPEAKRFNRFSDYPWRPENQTLVYELCPFRRLFNLHPFYLRLERIGEATQ